MNLRYGTVSPAQKRFTFVYSLFFSFALLLIFALVSSYFFNNTLWMDKNFLMHSVLEIICIFIAMCIFIVIWYTYKSNPPYLNCLGLGFLVVTLYEVLHILYYPNPDIGDLSDLSTKFWILSNLTEAIIILLFVTTTIIYKIGNKYVSLLITLMVGGIPSFLILKYNSLLPVLLNADGFTYAKIALEYVIIAINAVSLVLLFKKVNIKDIVSYYHVYIALLISVTSGFAFAHLGSFTSFYNALGHILKIINFFYLFNGVFKSSITYPYKKLYDNLGFTHDLVNQFPSGLVMYNEQDRLILINDMAKSILNLENNNVLGMSRDEFKQMVGLNNVDNYSGLNFLPVNENFEKVESITRADGKKVILNVQSKNLESGKLIIFNEALVDQDMTSLRLQTRTILDSFKNVALLYDIYGKVIVCNKAFSELTGMDNNVIIGMDINELWDVYLMPHISSIDADIKYETSNDDTLREMVFLTPSGESKVFLFNFAPVINYEGKQTAVMAVGSDITVLREQQEIIIQQEKLAMLGQMGASIVHETKNFLTTIKGGSQLLALVAEDPQVKIIAQKIDSATDDVNRIITDFLLLSKPKSTMYIDISMSDMISSIRSMLETSTFMKGVNIRLFISEKEKRVYCDEAQIKQVLFNIAKNGVEAMSEVKDPILDIRTYIDSQQKAMVIEISDKGKGISQGDMDKISTPFFTTKKNGTGLGLSVCYQIIKEHGGTINIKSKLGSGTTFIISLPYIE